MDNTGQNNATYTPSPIASQPPPAGMSKSKKPIFIALAVVGIVILALLGILFFRGNNPGSQEPFVLSINNQQVPSTDFLNAVEFYRKSESMDKNTALSFVQQLYKDNFVLKQEYLANGHTQKELDKAVTTFPLPSNLQAAPAGLVRVNAENEIMKKSLASKIGIRTRSGNIMTLGLLEKMSENDDRVYTALIKQRLGFYAQQLNSGKSYDEVKAAFLADTLIKSRPKINQLASNFTDMPASHPFLAGDEFINTVFNTPQNTASDVFVSVSGDSKIFGVVYPTSPIVDGDSGSMRDWLLNKEKTLEIKSDFSKIK